MLVEEAPREDNGGGDERSGMRGGGWLTEILNGPNDCKEAAGEKVV